VAPLAGIGCPNLVGARSDRPEALIEVRDGSSLFWLKPERIEWVGLRATMLTSTVLLARSWRVEAFLRYRLNWLPTALFAFIGPGWFGGDRSLGLRCARAVTST
jgi:hypothetical protein